MRNYVRPTSAHFCSGPILLLSIAYLQIISISSTSIGDDGGQATEINQSLYGHLLESPQSDDGGAGEVSSLEPTLYYLRSGRATYHDRQMADSKNQNKYPSRFFEKANMLRTRRAMMKKESGGSGSGKGDRWADFNLLRTGRSDPDPWWSKMHLRTGKRESRRISHQKNLDRMHLRTRKSSEEPFPLYFESDARQELLDEVPTAENLVERPRRNLLKSHQDTDIANRKQDRAKWLMLRTRKSELEENSNPWSLAIINENDQPERMDPNDSSFYEDGSLMDILIN